MAVAMCPHDDYDDVLNSMEIGRGGRLMRLRRMGRMPLVSPRLWWRRVVFWVGAVLVATVAVGFAKAADWAGGLFLHFAAGHAWLPFIIAPAGLTIAFLLTRHVFPGAQGSGIPQTIAALHMHEPAMVDRVLSPRIAVGKVLLTLLGLASGASIGREGPTVQVGASIMHALGKLLRLPRLELRRALVLAGGAAGIAAAFNTPLAGIVFAIEELSHSFEFADIRHCFHRCRRGGCHDIGTCRQLYLFRPDRGRDAQQRRLAGGDPVQRRRRISRRDIQPVADYRRPRAAGLVRPDDHAPSGCVRRALRTAAGGDRPAVRRPDLWYRLCAGERDG